MSTTRRTLTSTLALAAMTTLFVATSQVAGGVRDQGPDFALTDQAPTAAFSIEALGTSNDATEGTLAWTLFLDVGGEDDATLSVQVTDCNGEVLDDAELSADLAVANHSVSFDSDYACAGAECSGQICVTFDTNTPPIDVDWTVEAGDNSRVVIFDELLIRSDL